MRDVCVARSVISKWSLLPIRMMFRETAIFPYRFKTPKALLITILLLLSHILVFLYDISELGMQYGL